VRHRLALLIVVLITAATICDAQAPVREPLQPGAIAPDFTATTLEGVPVTLAQWQDRVVVLNYFITWYRDAAEHLGMMEELQDTYSAEGMRLLSISLDEGERGLQQVRDLLREKQIAHPIVLDPEQLVAGVYGVRALPAIFVIGRDGKIVYYHEGYSEGDEVRLARVIAQALGVDTPEEPTTEATDTTAEEPATAEAAEAPEEPVCRCFRQEGQ
jgi:alkyl hydroperoxide reductase subunit AhpC